MKQMLGQVLAAATVALLAAGAATTQPATSQPAAKNSAATVLGNLAGKLKKTWTTPTSQPAQTPARTEPGALLRSLRPQAEPDDGAIEPSERRLGSRSLTPTIKVGVDPRVLGVLPGMPAPTLKREGDYLRMRRGRIVQAPDIGYALFVFDSSDDAETASLPLVLVPCQTLQSMEDLVHERGDRFVFTLSGQILQYRGVNYLLPTMQRPPIAATSQPAVSNHPRDLATSEVLKKLQTKVKGNVMLEPAPPPSGRNTGRRATPRLGRQPLGVAPAMPTSELKREGQYIRMRRGRIVPAPQGDQILFVFDADSTDMADPPMTLVPCQALESMEEQVRKLGDRIVFVLSGQVLEYRGANYLLPTMMKLAIRRGNLRK